MTVPITIKVLKDRRVRIHFFVRSEKGPIQTEPDIHLAPGIKPVRIGGAKGFVACQPQRKRLAGEMLNGRVLVFPCSDEVRAVTCDLCLATDEFKKAAEELAAVLAEHA